MQRYAFLLIGLALLSGCAAEIQAQAPTHVLLVNDGEARQLTGKRSLAHAAEAIQAMKWPTYMPAAEATAYHDFRA